MGKAHQGSSALRKEVGFSEKEAALYWLEEGLWVEPLGIHTCDPGMLLEVLPLQERYDRAGEGTQKEPESDSRDRQLIKKDETVV